MVVIIRVKDGVINQLVTRARGPHTVPFGNQTWQSGKSLVNGGFNWKIIYERWIFHCHVWLPDGKYSPSKSMQMILPLPPSPRFTLRFPWHISDRTKMYVLSIGRRMYRGGMCYVTATANRIAHWFNICLVGLVATFCYGLSILCQCLYLTTETKLLQGNWASHDESPRILMVQGIIWWT